VEEEERARVMTPGRYSNDPDEAFLRKVSIMGPCHLPLNFYGEEIAYSIEQKQKKYKELSERKESGEIRYRG